MDTNSEVEHVLTIACPERPGIVHAVTGFLLEQGRDIVELKQFGDRRAGQFFMRVDVAGADAPALTKAMSAAFEPIAQALDAQWTLVPKGTKRRVLIMVSKFDHCLNDLLHRARLGELPIDVVAVVSNHRDHEELVKWHQIPFFHVPVTADTKPAAEARLLELIDAYDVELVVLARYMQVLSDELSRKLTGMTINIHHSFLPSFKGAKPYYQAHDRGVKLIGATAHYVTADLDEGPIIEQDVARAYHTDTVDDLTARGQDTESQVLARAVKWHSEHRVLMNGHKTVIFR